LIWWSLHLELGLFFFYAKVDSEHGDEVAEEADSIIILSLTILRYSVSFARIYSLLKSVRNNFRVKNAKIVLDINQPTEKDPLFGSDITSNPTNNNVDVQSDEEQDFLEEKKKSMTLMKMCNHSK